MRRRWLRYSLRTLLVLVFVASVGFAWLAAKVNQGREQAALVEHVQQLGGTVFYDFQVTETPGGPEPDATRTRAGNECLRRWLGNDVFDKVVGVRFSSQYLGTTPGTSVQIGNTMICKNAEAELRRLEPFADLEWLDLSCSELTDASVDQLVKFQKLRRLELSATHVTEDGLARLRTALPNCKISYWRPPEEAVQRPSNPPSRNPLPPKGKP
ncbi:MAG: hypothetical protein HYS13_08180 [Planctomycetia bacterium]|nr:hypothetical protein [Planctomycetia bacterium]